MAIVYRTTGSWGPGKGANLTPAEVDKNFNELLTAIQSLAASGPKEITAIEISGTQMSLRLSDDSIIGPVGLPLAYPTWRGAFVGETIYKRGDLVRAFDTTVTPALLSWYAVNIDHTSDVAFNPARTINSQFVYSRIIPIAYSVDIGFYFPGSPGAGISNNMLGYLAVKRFTLPKDLPASRARLGNYALNPMMMEIHHNDSKVGELHFEDSVYTGTFVFDNDVLVMPGDRIAIKPPSPLDVTANDLFVTLLGYSEF